MSFSIVLCDFSLIWPGQLLPLVEKPRAVPNSTINFGHNLSESRIIRHVTELYRVELCLEDILEGDTMKIDV